MPNVGGQFPGIGKNAALVGAQVTRVGVCLTSVGRQVSRIGFDATRVGVDVTRVGICLASVGRQVSRIGFDATRVGADVTRVGICLTSVGGYFSRIGFSGTRVPDDLADIGICLPYARNCLTLVRLSVPNVGLALLLVVIRASVLGATLLVRRRHERIMPFFEPITREPPPTLAFGGTDTLAEVVQKVKHVPTPPAPSPKTACVQTKRDPSSFGSNLQPRTPGIVPERARQSVWAAAEL